MDAAFPKTEGALVSMFENGAALAGVDRDGALEETAAVVGLSRLEVLRRGALGGVGLVAGGALLGTGSALAAPSKAGDVAILNFALTLEYLEAAFYAEAVSFGALTGELASFAKVVAKHEAAHVAAIKATIPKLGGKPVAKPKFNFHGTTHSWKTFIRTSIALESTGVTAYLGQAGNIKTPAVLHAAASILAVEARHAAWVLDIDARGQGLLPAPAAFQPSRNKAEVLAIVKKTGFIVG